MKVKLLKKVRKMYSIYLEKNNKNEDVYCVKHMTDWCDYARDYRSRGCYDTLEEAIKKRNKLILKYCRQFYRPKKII